MIEFVGERLLEGGDVNVEYEKENIYEKVGTTSTGAIDCAAPPFASSMTARSYAVIYSAFLLIVCGHACDYFR